MTFKPGNSLATHSSQPGRPSLRPVAYSGSDGRLRLDFGDVRAGAQISFCDVLRATSSSSSPQHVAFTVTGASAAFVQRVTFGDLGPVDGLDPGQTRRVAATLVAPRQAVPGTYTGILSVSVLGTNERHELPMTVTIIGRKPHPDHTPVHPPIPASSPIPAPPSPSPSPSPSSSAGPSVSPVPSPSPSPVQIFSLKPGESTLLPSADGSVPPAVAQELPDGGLRLDFGAVPTRPAIEFPDVLRLGSVAVTMTEVSLELSGLPEGVVQVGLWDAERGLVTSGLTLTPGEEARIAFSFDFADSPPDGLLEGRLTVVVREDEGASQRSTLPIALTVTRPESETEASPSPETDASPTALSRGAFSRQAVAGSLWSPVVLRLGRLL